MTTINEDVFKIVAQVAKKKSEDLNLETRLAEDLMLKSMSKIELAALLENKFNITISNFEIRLPKNIKEIIELVQSKIK
ncbi:acyl carrier protein [Geosporobacter ferrireducens]|uniref:Carrier domain-containing protein n=1 Tax=Geosporobacter ferrireducens TaxID=1424294 RepID=A0A1D8GF84_9FIRM|nr:acyl carrier protein [Geosporobacter ferrireducens]AOT69567.1 hypothetical protein Gferi_08240 [Geosporobacter ferrireducens]MTI54738.1 acyl carrier protein [Geosporobacter ferrireducens]